MKLFFSALLGAEISFCGLAQGFHYDYELSKVTTASCLLLWKKIALTTVENKVVMQRRTVKNATGNLQRHFSLPNNINCGIIHHYCQPSRLLNECWLHAYCMCSTENLFSFYVDFAGLPDSHKKGDLSSSRLLSFTTLRIHRQKHKYYELLTTI